MFCGPGDPALIQQRPALTPGRLYALMSAEFQEVRSRQCIGCIMPMLYTVEDAGMGANWALEPMGRRCPACEKNVARIRAKYAALYDVRDPGIARLP